MVKYILKRLAQSLITLFIVITVVFLLLRQMPIEGYFANADKLTETQRVAILDKFGVNDPILVQLKDFYSGLIRGDLGTSIIYREEVPVTKIIAEKAPISIAFGLTAMTISLVLGITLGSIMAKSKNKIWDKLGTGFIVIVNAVPAAIYYLFLQLYLTKITGATVFDQYNPLSWIVPVLSMSLGGTASYAMWMRRYMVDELNKDYVKLARAKGFTQKQIIKGHVFRNAFVPMIQYLPTSLLYTVAGSIYIESLYSIPGMGGLLVNVIQRQDNTLVQAIVIIYSSIGIIGLLLGDILMTMVDPRIKFGAKEGSR